MGYTKPEKNMSMRKFQDLNSCRFKCRDRISRELRIHAFNEYWSLGSYKKRVEYISKRINFFPKLLTTPSKNKKPRFTFRYYIYGYDRTIHLACKGCFLRIFDERFWYLKRICNNLQENGAHLSQLNTKSSEDEDVRHSEEEEIDDYLSLLAAAGLPVPPTTSQGNKNDVMRCVNQLESLPIVYTTRLDDMSIRPFHKFEPALYFEKIFNESRPKLTSRSLKNQTPYVAKLDSYRQLNLTIMKVNKRIRRQKWIMDREYKRSIGISQIQMIFRNFKDTQNLDINPIPESRDEQSTQQQSTSVNENDIFNLSSYSYRFNYFVIRNRKRNEADVYYFNENGAVTQHYICNTSLESLYTPTIKNAEITYCCWYQREETLSSMDRFLPTLTLKYMRKPHPCEASQCTCCCKQKVYSLEKTKKFSNNLNTPTNPTARVVAKMSAERKVAPKKLNVLIDDMLNTSTNWTPITKVISKAFAFHPQITQTLQLGSTGLGTGLNQNSNLDYNVVHIFMHYTKGGNEYYQIGTDGYVVEHLKNVNESFMQECVAHYKNCEYEKICCWQNREYFLHKLKNMNMVPKPKYLKSSHNCPPDKCICCCKLWKKTKLLDNLKEINLPEIANCSDSAYSKIPSVKFVFANIEPVIPDHVIAELEKSSPSSSKGKTIDLSAEKEDDTALRDSKYKLICENAMLIIGSKITKLKNTRVSVNDKEKVTAALHFPVTKLITSELKILNDILTQAQRSVDTLNKMSTQCNSNIILNNTSLLKPSEAELNGKNNSTNYRLIAKSQLKKPPVEHLRSKMYSLMSKWSYIQDETYDKAVKSFFRTSALHKINTVTPHTQKRPKEKDVGQIESRNKLPKKGRGRKPNDTNLINMLVIEEPEVYVNNFDGSNVESVDPLALNNDNSLNNNNQLASYVKNPLLQATEDIPIAIIKKNAKNLPQTLTQPLESVCLEVPSNTTPMVLNSGNFDLEEEIPVNSIFGFKVKQEPKNFTENNDCILGP